MQKKQTISTVDLSTYLTLTAFNQESDHRIILQINNEIVWEKTLQKNVTHSLKIFNNFPFQKTKPNTLMITWDGDQDCENKFLKIFKLIINDQHIAPHSVIIDPVENQYIKMLKTTEKGRIEYKEKLLYPGHQHGWYGDYKFCFSVDRRHSGRFALGIRDELIYSDVKQAILSKKKAKRI